MHKGVKVGLIGLGGMVGVIALGIGALKFHTHTRVTEVQQRADTHLTQIDEVSDNETVRSLDQQLTTLNLQPTTETAYPAEDLTNLTFWQDLDSYLTETVLSQTSGPVPLPPDSVQAYLQTHSATIEEIANTLNNSPVPQWQFSVTEISFSDPLPHHQSTRLLHRLLLAQSAIEENQGNRANSAKFISAAGQIWSGLSQSPFLLYQIHGQMMAKEELMLSRLLGHSNIDSTRDFSSEILTSHVVDMSLFFTSAKSELMSAKDFRSTFSASFGFNPGLAMTRDMTMLYLSYETEQVLNSVEEMRAFENCESQLSLQPETPWASMSPFDYLMGPSSQTYWQAIDLSLTAELNQLIEKARDSELQDSDLLSAVCPGQQWMYEAKEDGGFSIEYGGQTHWRVDDDYRHWPALSYEEKI